MPHQKWADNCSDYLSLWILSFWGLSSSGSQILQSLTLAVAVRFFNNYLFTLSYFTLARAMSHINGKIQLVPLPTLVVGTPPEFWQIQNTMQQPARLAKAKPKTSLASYKLLRIFQQNQHGIGVQLPAWQTAYCSKRFPNCQPWSFSTYQTGEHT